MTMREMRDELEAALADRWDDENLAVYGDHLQAEGDPRGELIAIDRAIDRTLADPDAVPAEQRLSEQDTAALAIDRRREHLVAWLGRPLASQLPEHGSTRYGFIDVTVDDDASLYFFRDLLASPARTYLRRLRVLGNERLLPAIKHLATAPNPWLQDLVILRLPRYEGPPVAISNHLAGGFIAATPRLHSMYLSHRRLFDELPHPHLRTLSIQGYDALGSLIGEGPPLPALERLSFAFSTTMDTPVPLSDRLLGTLLPAARLPALRELDLSKNEPTTGQPFEPGALHHGGVVDPFRFLLALAPALADRLVRLAVPAVRTQQQEQALSTALARMPALEHLDIPHTYRCFAQPSGLHHPTAAIRIARPWPWPPLDRLVHYDRVHLVELLPIGSQLSLVRLASHLEAVWDRLPPEAYPRWTAFWDVFEPLLGGAQVTTVHSLRIVDAFATLLQWRDVPEWSIVFSTLRAAHHPRMLTVLRVV
jgi:hypothetical protein